ncbi:MAG: hypothetical protein H6819_05725 [Phycisphaerales bacterium]|nr:hypothetical protein [Phycisphaerales bacterium]MCB9854720.1 hypothetical protein [Phycisphaerales bacterium]
MDGSTPAGNPLTDLLTQVNDGVPGSADRLFDIVYAELKQRARSQLLKGPMPAGSLSPTTLVHETYLRLLGENARSRPGWASERHFYFTVARAMRDILIETYRRNSAQKRGSNVKAMQLPEDIPAPETEDPQAIADAVDELKRANPVAGSVADLRVFGGLTHDEIGSVLGIANSSARRQWKFALGFLADRLKA